ncbi:MAG TPA: VWA domain-containing protein [Kiloniellales bacterium]|nr:VWA domain-containing protein [Kiloniellales bacterium]
MTQAQSDPFAEAARKLRHDSGSVSPDETGRLADNLLYFARTLRAAGLPVGPGQVLAALEAVQAIGLSRRDDFYWALHAVFVNRHDQEELFAQTFHLFWRNPKLLERMRALLLPEMEVEPEPDSAQEVSRRVAEALQQNQGQKEQTREDEVEIDATLTWSDRETLNKQDFEKMSPAEVEAAKAAIRQLKLPIKEIPTRRFRPSTTPGRADLRASLRQALRSGGDVIPIEWRRQRARPPALVVLCDISGSMSRYARLFLHFMHAITSDRDRVFSFLFGTRLTNVTRFLREKDIDIALEQVGSAAEDWSGGTRIGACLEEFNRRWSRRVLGQGALVLLITDGLDREGGSNLSRQMERLHKSCRRLIWLNPLLRWEGYEPKAQGARAIMPHVDDFRPVHNLESLSALTAVLSEEPRRRLEGHDKWLKERSA